MEQFNEIVALCSILSQLFVSSAKLATFECNDRWNRSTKTPLGEFEGLKCVRMLFLFANSMNRGQSNALSAAQCPISYPVIAMSDRKNAIIGVIVSFGVDMVNRYRVASSIIVNIPFWS